MNKIECAKCGGANYYNADRGFTQCLPCHLREHYPGQAVCVCGKSVYDASRYTCCLQCSAKAGAAASVRPGQVMCGCGRSTYDPKRFQTCWYCAQDRLKYIGYHPQRCPCGRGDFNAAVYQECKQCHDERAMRLPRR